MSLSRSVLCLALPAFVVTAQPSSGECVTNRGSTANFGTVLLSVSGGLSSLPSNLQAGISMGAEAWNSTACNQGGDDFPKFVLSGSAGTSLGIVYSSGVSQGTDAGGNTVCARYSGRTDGTGGTIELYGQFKLAEGGTFPCFPTSGDAADSVAHELGHFLGLGDSTCDSYIMGPRSFFFSGGSALFGDRQLQASECSAADENNTTRQEEIAECTSNCTDGGPTDPGVGSVGGGTSPIVIDLSGNGFRFTDLEHGTAFDLDVDGFQERTAWSLGRDDAFLVLDRNGNGWIDNGWELFGDRTPQPDSAAPNGYRALAVFDEPLQGGNSDGRITAADSVFQELQLWIDLNRDGRSQAGELSSLADWGVSVLSLSYVESRRRDRHGNALRYKGYVEVHEGRNRVPSVDVFFVAE